PSGGGACPPVVGVRRREAAANMAAAAAPPGPRNAGAPRPAAPPPVPLPEGWQPGGAASPLAPARPGPPARHGTCRLTLKIGATEYPLRPFPPADGPDLPATWARPKTPAGPPPPPAASPPRPPLARGPGSST